MAHLPRCLPLIRCHTMCRYVLNARRSRTPIYPKDASTIFTLLDVLPGARLLEAGTGNAGLTMFLARAVGETGRVDTVERSESTHKHAKNIVRGFARGFFLPQIRFYVGSVGDVVPEIGRLPGESESGIYDGMVLDMPSPWSELPSLVPYLKTDRYCVCYLPNMSQVMDLVGACRPWPLLVERVLEVEWREWDVRTTLVRCGDASPPPEAAEDDAGDLQRQQQQPPVAWVCHPSHRPKGHTAFLVCLRRCRQQPQPDSLT
ncbi:hypothetical protein EV182_000524 [Spiromyces aspiralis]|uniref:Uncharacterized protein n=1 Tax=Spiromyces aspiralis TaxID=68401 RepID=A0ACC1HUR8_9FUNG|nr:hypothetical protein EV182_000524 [Spiromyces aspiralis]